MSLLARLRRRASSSLSHASGRRAFFRRLSGLSLGALGAGLLTTDQVWAAVEARANQFGIIPGTLVDATGRPLRRAPSVQEPLLAEIMLFAGNFAPRGWAFCDGQLLAISQYTALFSILGTTYGGDGRTTFGLPDLRGRVPIGPGTGPGLSNRPLGARGGAEQVTLSVTQLASHAHITQKSSDEPAGAGTGNYPLQRVLDDDLVVPGATTDTTGGGQPHENMPPFLAVYYCIALQGIFPSRN